MHLSSIPRHFFKLMMAAIFAATASSVYSQVVPATRGSAGRLPLSVGGGYSYFDVDWGKTRMGGYAGWIDVPMPGMPYFLNGLMIEAEGRDVLWNPGDKGKTFSQRTGGGGVLYEMHRFRDFKLYAKGLVSYGFIDFGGCLVSCNTTHPYTNDSRVTYAPGGGMEYRIHRNIWARADYEYQFWPHFLGKTLDPQGFTFGAMYDFRRSQR
jgi:opacity protein-like surface antigen